MAEELQQGRWELPATSLDPSSSSFLGPQAAYIDGRVACTREAGGAAAEEGSSLVDIAEVGYFGLMQSSLNSGPVMARKPASGLCMQQRLHDQQGLREELRQLIPAAPLPQPRRQPNYSIPTSRQFSRSVPSSPTFATSRLQMSPAMNTGGGGSAGASRRGNVLPTVARNVAAYSQQASSSASVLTSSLDLASCTSILVPPSPGSIKSASFSGDHKAAAATSSTFSSDHSARAAKFSSDQAAAVRTTSLASDHRARSANFGSDQSAAARAAGFTSEEAARSVNFSSELAAAASLFLPFLPCTPASSTTSMNPAAGEQDHQVQAASTSGAATSIAGAKKRRLQPAGVRSKSSSKLGGEDGHVAAATQDTMSLGEALPLILSQGGADVDITPTGIEMSNNSANIEGEESTMKGNSTITSPSTCMKTQVCDGPSPPKQDYIHVRARRGQATDSHSLAERVRREKISERMKFLQDLVPGCNKITGKAVMLDEIINYVQSLQRQVEFLSMKLSAFNPQTSKFEASHIINHLEPKSIQIGTTQQFNQIENHYHGQHDLHLSVSLLQSDVQQQAAQLQQQSVNTGAHEAWEDELQSLVQMGFPTLP